MYKETYFKNHSYLIIQNIYYVNNPLSQSIFDSYIFK